MCRAPVSKLNCQGNMSAHRRRTDTKPWTAGVQFYHMYSNHRHEWHHAQQAGAGSPGNLQLPVLTLREGARVGHRSTQKKEAIYVYSQERGRPYSQVGQDLEILKKTGIFSNRNNITKMGPILSIGRKIFTIRGFLLSIFLEYGSGNIISSILENISPIDGQYSKDWTKFSSRGPFLSMGQDVREEDYICFERFCRRKIRLIESNVKCRYLKKFTCKGSVFAAGAYLIGAPSPPRFLFWVVRQFCSF
jgi:hypothetical protein